MKYPAFVFALFLLFVSASQGFAQDSQSMPTQVYQIIDYLENKEAPLPNGKKYTLGPVTWAIFDVDGDGVDEIFLQSVPRYRQSPTVTIFQVDKAGIVSKKLEGLAPGKLIAIPENDPCLNPHTLAYAFDTPLNAKSPEKFKALADSAFTSGKSVVLYRHFGHSDKRRAANFFIDLTHLETDRTTCADFTFPQPEQIAAGKIPGKKKGVFVARVSDRLYCYEIKGFTKRGFMDKTITSATLPDDFQAFEMVKDQIKYRTTDGKTKNLKL